jgi:hypothetical protein
LSLVATTRRHAAFPAPRTIAVELNRKQLDALEERGYLYPFERGNRAH